jgi:hypothetical protein
VGKRGQGTALPPLHRNTVQHCLAQHNQANTTLLTAQLVHVPAPCGCDVISCFFCGSHELLSWLVLLLPPAALQVTVPTFNKWFEDSVAAFQRTAQSRLPSISPNGWESDTTDAGSLPETSFASGPPSPVASGPLQVPTASPPSMFGSTRRVAPTRLSTDFGPKVDRAPTSRLNSHRPKWSTLAQKQCVQKHVVNTYLQV